jgi:ribosomal subunit interface protein
VLNIEIVGRHVKITAELEAYALSKADRIAKFVKSDARIELILDHEHDRFQAEMIVASHRGPVVVGHVQHEHAHAAIDLVVDKVDHQLRRMRDRRKGHHGGQSMAGDGSRHAPRDEQFDPGDGEPNDVLPKD